MKIHIYTDGGCRNNQEEGNIGAWAYTMSYGKHKKEDYATEIETTNNRQELKAIINALKAIKTTDKPVIVYTDSAYALNGITKWIHNWKKKDWKNSKKKDVMNKDLWQILDKLRNKQENIEWVKVKGHATNEGNNRADALVNKAMDSKKGEIG